MTLGQLDEAIERQRGQLIRCEDELGLAHASTLRTLEALARLLENKGEIEEAAALRRRGLQAWAQEPANLAVITDAGPLGLEERERKVRRVSHDWDKIGAPIVERLAKRRIDSVIVGTFALNRWSAPRYPLTLDFMVSPATAAALDREFITQPLAGTARPGRMTTLNNEDEVRFLFSNEGEDFLYAQRETLLGLPVAGRNQLLYLKLLYPHTAHYTDVVYISMGMMPEAVDEFHSFLANSQGLSVKSSTLMRRFDELHAVAKLERAGRNREASKRSRAFLLQELSCAT